MPQDLSYNRDVVDGMKEMCENSPAMLQRGALERAMAIAEFALDGTLNRANDNYLNLFGYHRADALGRNHRSFCPLSFAESEEYPAFWQNLHAGNAYSGQIERMRHDGAICWLEATYAPVHDESGKVVQILKIATDITARKLREDTQQQHLRRLSLVADASDSAVVISDASPCIVYVNAGFTRMFGWYDEDARGKGPVSLLAPDKDQDYIDTYKNSLSSGHSVEREEIVQGKDGQRYWVKVISNPILDDDGQWQLTVTILTDITRAKMYEVLQQKVLEAMAREQPLTEVLELISEEVERIAPEITASILEVDKKGQLHPLASPNLPTEYSQKLEGLAIGPCVGSCGKAAWKNDAVRSMISRTIRFGRIIGSWFYRWVSSVAGQLQFATVRAGLSALSRSISAARETCLPLSSINDWWRPVPFSVR